MTRSIVKLPADVEEHFEVYANGVLQQPDIDYYLDSSKPIFERALRQTASPAGAGSSARGASGPTAKTTPSTSRYEANDEMRVEHETPIALSDEPDDES